MKVNFNTDSVFNISNSSSNPISNMCFSKINSKQQKDKENIKSVIDKLGILSASAQGLKQVITSYSLLSLNEDHRIYIYAKDNTVFGFLKTGFKKLFLYDTFNNIKEVKPLCVLDFYVFESKQRLGIGKKIFDEMLISEGSYASKLAYDRPSEKLIGFLKKYYGLKNFVIQNNNFVVFDEFWVCDQKDEIKGRGLVGKKNCIPLSLSDKKDDLLIDELNEKMMKVSINDKKNEKVEKKEAIIKTKKNTPWATYDEDDEKYTKKQKESHYIKSSDNYGLYYKQMTMINNKK